MLRAKAQERAPKIWAKKTRHWAGVGITYSSTVFRMHSFVEDCCELFHGQIAEVIVMLSVLVEHALIASCARHMGIEILPLEATPPIQVINEDSGRDHQFSLGIAIEAVEGNIFTEHRGKLFKLCSLCRAQKP